MLHGFRVIPATIAGVQPFNVRCDRQKLYHAKVPFKVPPARRAWHPAAIATH